MKENKIEDVGDQSHFYKQRELTISPGRNTCMMVKGPDASLIPVIHSKGSHSSSKAELTLVY